MIAMNVEVRVAAISFEHRLIRYLKEEQINRSPTRGEDSCCFYLPHSLTLAFLIRCKAFDGLAKKFWFTLQRSGTEMVTREFTISGTDYEIGHVIAPNASRSGLPSTDLDMKLFHGLENEDVITLALGKEKDGPALETFCFKAMKPKSKEDAIFSSDSPIRFAPHFASQSTSKKRTETAHSDKASNHHKKLKKNDGKFASKRDAHRKGNGLKVLDLSESVATSVKDEEEEVHHISKKSEDRGTPPEIIMQQEQREIIRDFEGKIELATNEYKKEKSKIDAKAGKLERNRHEKKKEFKHKVHELQRAKMAAQEKLDWIIANTAPIEVEASEGEERASKDNCKRPRQAAESVTISDSESDNSSESESDSGEDSYSSTISSPPMKSSSVKPEGSSSVKK
ncbi:uncharacterized protein FA14DRAFT_177211 [Meira miltonrushii]|uniref:Uncharacterized protein n=1 Tax=Meira miltonrushii TaxID=1280837 RepID=A0A316VK13_9BASI|nr:uncharacterized protein FA14DRAFT_177211 [Meira miltonrushii]PWN37932.1 hypothetical protein FA14DRAFT_177211 [Meira miltonrushii]